jgi:hypothetical protein
MATRDVPYILADTHSNVLRAKEQGLDLGQVGIESQQLR